MSQNKTKKDEKEIFTKEFIKANKVISAQADLQLINWTNGLAWGVDSASLRKLRNHEKKVAENLKKLEAWAGRTRPKGVYLSTARYIYKSYNRELERVRQKTLELSEILDKATEV